MANYQADPDVALMMRVSRGDEAAFEQLVLKYQKPVINFVFRYTGNAAAAEDIAQDVFVRAYRAASSYRPDAKFSTWLFTIVRNLCSNYRTREGRLDQRMDSEADMNVILPGEPSPEDLAVRKEIEERIQEAIQSLPESLRIPLILHQFQEMQYDEVAQVLGISLAAVKVRIHRAKLNLAEKLRPYIEGVT